jgi:TOMM system kinase/cyclase fusion protein
MDFYEVLANVIELLQREGRASYRALKRQYNLDDQYLDDLKEELLFSYPVVDEDGRGLVWTGQAGADPEPASTATQAGQPEVAPQPSQAEPPPSEPYTPDAERRQLTVMFCDLVGSTPLSEQLDPEDLREVVRAYQQTCTEVVQHFDGHVAQLLGDALLVYFGWPQAHEDDAQRAVRTGLGMLEAMQTLNTRLEQDKGIRLAIRVGIHTGLVVVGEMGGGGHHEQLALGGTPNVASRLQGLAGADTVTISAATARLVQGYFDLDDLGEHRLKGVAEPIRVYRVQGETETQSRFEVTARRGLTPLVGREDEVALLLRRWAQSRGGRGQVVLLCGEAGIGKSRLVEVMREHVSRDGAPRIAFRCSPYHTHSALYPVVVHVQRLLQFQRDDTPEVKLAKLERGLHTYGWSLDETVPLLAGLLSVPLSDRYTPVTLTPQRQRQLTLEMLVTWLFVEADRQPAVLVVEDLHWADPSTLEMLSLLIDRIATAPMLTLLTFRPEFQSPWPMAAHMLHLTLNRFNAQQVERIATAVAGGKRLPGEVVQQVVSRTDGVPLFVEEVTKTVVESGLLQEEGDHFDLTGPLTTVAIPATLHDALLARLDRLGEAKQVAQLGAALGRTFPYELLYAVARRDAGPLQQALARLVDAELLTSRGVWPQATYTFKHALIRDAAYQSLLKTARQQLHQRTAQVLETQFPETVATQPELLAHHYTEAGRIEEAVGYWQRAGQRAVERSANLEAVAHLTKGLELLASLPDTPERAQQELVMLATLAPALRNTKGRAAPEVRETYARAYALCQQVKDAPQLFPILRGLWNYYNNRAELQTAHELGEQLFALAQCQDDPTQLMWGHCVLGMQDQYYHGAFAGARGHFERAIRLYDCRHQPSLALLYGQDPGVVALSFLAWMVWMLGSPDQALRQGHEALTLAQELTHPYSLAAALNWAALLHQFRREWHAVREQAEAMIAITSEYGFAQRLAWGTVLRGWALAAQGQASEGIEQIHRGLTAFRATGQELFRPYNLALLAEAYGQGGRVDEGLQALDEALALVETTGECLWEPELYRLKGELLLQADDAWRQAVYTPATCFQQAVEVARRRQARALELRAATSLARLWQAQDKRQEAYELLAPVYEWFTEGFDTADLQEAKGLLEELS